MKKILLISGIQIFPPQSGGQLRTAALAQSLAGVGYQVRIFSLTGRKKDYLHFRNSSTQSPSAGITEYVTRSWLSAFCQFLTYRFRVPDFWHLFSIFPNRLLNRWRKESDYAIADFPFLMRYLKGPAIRILNSHNLEHERWHFFSPFVREIEKRAAKKAEIVLVSSENERKFYEKCGKAGLQVLQIANGILPDRFHFEPSTRRKLREQLGFDDRRKVILFAASQYAPNREAFEFLSKFEQENAKWLEEQHLSFLVVGSVAPAPVRRKNLVATGSVDAVEPYFGAADFAINPVKSGSGTNIKMAEYLVAKLPTLTTPFGKRGYLLEDGVDSMLFDWSELKAGLSTLCEMVPEARAQMAEGAYARNRHLIDMNAIVEKALLPLLS